MAPIRSMTTSIGFTLSLLLALLVLLSSSSPVVSADNLNPYAYVLVHGFTGWGRSELNGFKYWGGNFDIQEDLNGLGYHVVTVAVGPVSSSWDRACELYAQLVGVKTDYGLAHSTAAGHTRYGEDYTGQALLPDLGKEGTSSRKVNLVCHSQGGQTCRLLTQLLYHGYEDEMNSGADVVSPLFLGGNEWVHTMTTLSTPHDGTSLISVLDKFLPFAKNLIFGLGALAGIGGDDEAKFYDFKLDQWGLEREAGEKFSTYVDRVFDSPAFSADNFDTALADMNPNGAYDFNQWVVAQPDIYYLTYTTESTYKGWPSNHQLPELFTLPVCWPAAVAMGGFTDEGSSPVPIDDSWFTNDCIVNLRAQKYPTVGSSDPVRDFDGTFVRGSWNFMANFAGWDHFDIVGLGDKTVKYKARDLIGLIASIPDDGAPSTTKRSVSEFTLPSNQFKALLGGRVSAGATVDEHNNPKKQREAFGELCAESTDLTEDDCNAINEQLSKQDLIDIDTDTTSAIEAAALRDENKSLRKQLKKQKARIDDLLNEASSVSPSSSGRGADLDVESHCESRSSSTGAASSLSSSLPFLCAVLCGSLATIMSLWM